MAVTLALDTNRYADLCRGNARAVEIAKAAEAIWLPFVVVGDCGRDLPPEAWDPETKRCCDGFS